MISLTSLNVAMERVSSGCVGVALMTFVTNSLLSMDLLHVIHHQTIPYLLQSATRARTIEMKIINS